MKKIVILFLTIALLVPVWGCGSESKEPIVGEWEEYYTSVDGSEVDVDVTVKATEDGNVSISGDVGNLEATWTREEDFETSAVYKLKTANGGEMTAFIEQDEEAASYDDLVLSLSETMFHMCERI